MAIEKSKRKMREEVLGPDWEVTNEVDCLSYNLRVKGLFRKLFLDPFKRFDDAREITPNTITVYNETYASLFQQKFPDCTIKIF